MKKKNHTLMLIVNIAPEFQFFALRGDEVGKEETTIASVKTEFGKIQESILKNGDLMFDQAFDLLTQFLKVIPFRRISAGTSLQIVHGLSIDHFLNDSLVLHELFLVFNGL